MKAEQFTSFSRENAIKVMTALSDFPCSKPFLQLDPKNLNQSFSLSKQRPIDLEIVFDKLLLGKYATIKDWESDIELIPTFVREFGQDKYLIFLANQMLKRFHKLNRKYSWYNRQNWYQEYTKQMNKLQSLNNNIPLAVSGRTTFQIPIITQNKPLNEPQTSTKIVNKNQQIVQAMFRNSIQRHNKNEKQSTTLNNQNPAGKVMKPPSRKIPKKPSPKNNSRNSLFGQIDLNGLPPQLPGVKKNNSQTISNRYQDETISPPDYNAINIQSSSNTYTPKIQISNEITQGYKSDSNEEEYIDVTDCF